MVRPSGMMPREDAFRCLPMKGCGDREGRTVYKNHATSMIVVKTRVNCVEGGLAFLRNFNTAPTTLSKSLDNSWDISRHPKLYRMMLAPSLVLFLAVAATSATPLLPLNGKTDVIFLEDSEPQVRERRSAFPGRAMMFHGYFGHGGTAGYPYQQGYPSSNGRSGFDPQGAMTAFAAGDAVSAGSSYYGGVDCANCGKKINGNGHKKNGNGNGNGNGHGIGNGNGFPNGNGNGNGEPIPEEPIPNGNGNGNGQPSAEEPEAAAYPDNKKENEVPAEDGYQGDQPAPEEPAKDEPQPPASAASPTPAASAPEGPKRLPADDTSSEEDDDYFVGRHNGKGRGRGTFYNSYFPMVFGAFPGLGGGRGGGDGADGGGAYNPGIATAIANSFSTGRGAVATSHATAYGGPQLTPNNGYRKNGSRTRPH